MTSDNLSSDQVLANAIHFLIEDGQTETASLLFACQVHEMYQWDAEYHITLVAPKAVCDALKFEGDKYSFALRRGAKEVPFSKMDLALHQFLRAKGLVPTDKMRQVT